MGILVLYLFINSDIKLKSANHSYNEIVVLSFTNCGFLVFTTDIVELDSILEQHALVKSLIIIIQNSLVQVDQNVSLCIIMFVVTSDLMTS